MYPLLKVIQCVLTGLRTTWMGWYNSWAKKYRAKWAVCERYFR